MLLKKRNTNKYKKQLDKLKKQVGMVEPKSTQTRVVEIITDKMHPYTFFIETLLLENWMQGCILSVIIPTTLVCVLFGPTIPTCFFNFSVAFYTFKTGH